ncbi:DUF6412 domain-containing protein [Actinacidiphila acidipaludis]|uniref:DUF6412 domain-containing protein n=1 Tax=Actinacidiphila acidipaludis TaxID=2873382 RepID=A0ABS7Q7Y9_9ACTN|nr:DUF6412 domain-containing protein [Streptomyces acidipaludis]MBY8879252.1 DUF6412 domain-containing protein [Streptomyces acidipaludis]
MVRCTAAVRLYVIALLALLAAVLLNQPGVAVAVASVAMAATAAAALLWLAVQAVASAAGPAVSGRIRTAIRDRELRTAFLAQRDPDAAGRSRPRAPGRRIPTAA